MNTKQLQELLGLAGGPTGRPQAATAGKTQPQQQQPAQNRFGGEIGKDGRAECVSPRL